MLDKWSRKQNKLAKQYLRNKEGLTINETREQLQDTREIWLKLYEILQTSGIDLSEYSRINSVHLQKENEQLYLVIQVFSHRNIVIDMKNAKSLTEQEVVSCFTNHSLLNLLGNRDFSFEQITPESALAFLDTYMTYQDVYERGPCLSYPIVKGKYKSYLSMDFATLQIGLSFVDPEEDRVNYMFFQDDELYGMSGECDRRVAALIGEQIKTALIPNDIVQQYVSHKEQYKLKYTNE